MKFFWERKSKEPERDFEQPVREDDPVTAPPDDIAPVVDLPDTLLLLTKREKETLYHFLEGRTMKEAAQLMGISIATVNTYSNSLYKKLRVNSRVQLVIDYHYLLGERHHKRSGSA